MKNPLPLLKRSLTEGATQLWRNKFLSLTTILLGALIIFLINLVFTLQFIADNSIKRLESKADFIVPLRENYDSFLLESLQNELQNFDTNITIKPAQKFTDFSAPPRLHIKFQNLTQVPEIFKTLKKVRYDAVVADWDTVGEKDFTALTNKLIQIRKSVDKAGLYLSILFFAGGILLMINTFRIVIFSRKNEIFIARIVGANTNFITIPFLVEGALLGLTACLTGILVFIFVLREINFLPGGQIFLYLWNDIFSTEIIIATTVGILGAWISIQKYIKGRFDT